MNKILVVEDNPSVLKALETSLSALGYEAVTAADAISAVAIARKHEPKLAIIDINLPGGNGFLVARRLQQLLQLSSMGLVFITASKQSGLRARAIEMGAKAFLEKPFGIPDLERVIEQALGNVQPLHDGSLVG